MDRDAAETFLFREARLLDRRQFRDWQQLFAAEFVYWVPANDPDADPDENCSIIYNGPAELEDRLTRMESDHFWVGDPPIRTLHVVSNVTVENSADGASIESNLVLYLYRSNDQRRDVPVQVVPAACEYRVAAADEAPRITFKKVTLLTCDGIVPLLPPVI